MLWKDGVTVLLWASEGGHTNIVGLLLDKKANINVKNKVCLGVGELRKMRTRYDELG